MIGGPLDRLKIPTIVKVEIPTNLIERAAEVAFINGLTIGLTAGLILGLLLGGMIWRRS